MTGNTSVEALAEKSFVIRWLMTEGRHITDAKSFLESFAACLRDAGVDVSRITTGVPVLHPQLFSVSSLWERDKGVTERRYRVDPSQDAILANSPIRSAYDGKPQRVNVHDFEDKKLGKVVPYGVYDVTANAGFVSVGITSDTAEFAVQSIRCWRERMGNQRYPDAHELTVTADCGGSNGARVRLWKVELQKLADETGLVIHVHHYPPGTSKWNKIEHRLFCHITQNWRGRPLTDRLAVVELIGATTTKTGLKVKSALDTRSYQKGIKISKAEMKSIDITGDQFHPEWNYTIRPRQPSKS